MSARRTKSALSSRAVQRRRRSQTRTSTRRAPRRAESAVEPAPLDGAIVLSAALLACFGIVMSYSTTAPLAMGAALPPLTARHLAGVAAAALCGFVAWRMPLLLWRRLAVVLWAATIALLVATLAFGMEANGARRWLAVPGLPLSIQAAEYARFATVLAVAALCARNIEERRRSAIGPALVLAGVPALLLLFQPDFGSAVVLVATAGVVVFAGGAPLRILFGPAAAVAALGLLYVASRPYALARVRGFFDPWSNAGAEGFQLVQSFVAFGRGGSFGVGLGDGRQKLFYLPEAHTDFILSVVAEELGLVGVLLVLGGFAAFALGGLRVARRAREPFALLLATGMTALVVVPAATNAAVVMGLLPTTGLTLPFLSHGSNALLCAAAAVGILLRIATHDAPPSPGRRERGRA